MLRPHNMMSLMTPQLMPTTSSSSSPPPSLGINPPSAGSTCPPASKQHQLVPAALSFLQPVGRHWFHLTNRINQSLSTTTPSPRAILCCTPHQPPHVMFSIDNILLSHAHRSEITLTCFHANRRGTSCMATRFHHNKPTYKLAIFLTDKTTPILRRESSDQPTPASTMIPPTSQSAPVTSGPTVSTSSMPSAKRLFELLLQGLLGNGVTVHSMFVKRYKANRNLKFNSMFLGGDGKLLRFLMRTSDGVLFGFLQQHIFCRT
ncbi:hypothetical protein FQA47_024284 [Oryzias melastigma]|uniref:Uncharacterized protein n=1 Tax=Oryzias melastigma TaxID=30732 RepID=A0A834BR77_ORYME|nr:hypothetical protein FQA47_024284 [Oryzias melastigma]